MNYEKELFLKDFIYLEVVAQVIFVVRQNVPLRGCQLTISSPVNSDLFSEEIT